MSCQIQIQDTKLFVEYYLSYLKHIHRKELEEILPLAFMGFLDILKFFFIICCIKIVQKCFKCVEHVKTL